MKGGLVFFLVFAVLVSGCSWTTQWTTKNVRYETRQGNIADYEKIQMYIDSKEDIIEVSLYNDIYSYTVKRNVVSKVGNTTLLEESPLLCTDCSIALGLLAALSDHGSESDDSERALYFMGGTGGAFLLKRRIE